MPRAPALELTPHNIRATLCPRWVDTQCSDKAIALSGDLATTRAADDSSHALGNTARPKEIAQPAIFLASDASSFVTEVPLFADGGFMIK